MSTPWAKELEQAQKTALLQDGKRKVHYTFKDGKELVEEYDGRSDELLLRKWRKKGALGDTKPWDIEVGESIAMEAPGKELAFKESVTNPIVVRKDTSDSFQWRIRNLPYPIENYVISIEERNIVVRTMNKKYFKKLNIPDMERLGQELKEGSVTAAHANNTLILTYKKPEDIREFEKRLLQRLKKLKSDGDVDQCKQQ